jgi:hypothetical protein
VIERNPIRIIVVTQHGENASGLFPQDAQALLLADLLFKASHFPEHISTPHRSNPIAA